MIEALDTEIVQVNFFRVLWVTEVHHCHHRHALQGFREPASLVPRHADERSPLSLMSYFDWKSLSVFVHIEACLWFMSFNTFVVIRVFNRLFTMELDAYTEQTDADILSYELHVLVSRSPGLGSELSCFIGGGKT